jgi:hypothetical protein
MNYKPPEEDGERKGSTVKVSSEKRTVSAPPSAVE